MIDTLKNYFRLHEFFLISILALVFILIRLPGVSLPLHQDEYKWPMIVSPAYEGASIPHPPLSQFIYRTAGYIVGFDTDFRFVPLLFGVINLCLLYYLLRFLYSKREAILGSLIYIFSYFSVLASLMVDTDGQVMPFFFLLSLISYFKIKNDSGKKYVWGILLIISCLLGFLVKVSFIIAIGAIIADFLWNYKENVTKHNILKILGVFMGGTFLLIILLYLVQFIFPFFNLKESVVYWRHFLVYDREWFQTLIQCGKAILSASPLLVLILFFSKKEEFLKVKVLYFFLSFAFVFYIILFDFSLGALDRYLQLMIMPLTILCAISISSLYQNWNAQTRKACIFGLVLGGVIFASQFLPHFVPPLHPKSEWLHRALTFKWNFVYPFSGGSGPLGFYVSFLFMALVWVTSLGALVVSKIKSNYKILSVAFILPIVILYNLVFIEEYLFGKINGHAPKLLENAVEYIKNNSDIQKVTVYNDNGGKEVQDTGKYRKRLYFDPKLNILKKIRSFNEYKEHYFILDIPHLNPDSIYQDYFDTCSIIYQESDKKIIATIYDCKDALDLTEY